MPDTNINPSDFASSLPIEDNWERLHDQISKAVNAELSRFPDIAVLEAGCGRDWPLNLPDIKFHLVGLDLDMDAMQARLDLENDLDEAIVGDLETIDLSDRKFNMIYCSYVIEHIENAEALLTRMITWLRPGGLLVLKFPVRESVFGFITRMTPFWFHVFYHRYILGVPDAGKAGHSPYPTFYHPIVSLKGLQKFMAHNDLDTAFITATNFRVSDNSLIQSTSKILCKVLSFLSFGKLHGDFSGLAVILRKPA